MNKRLIYKKATKYDLDWCLVAAITKWFSNGNPWHCEFNAELHQSCMRFFSRDSLTGTCPKDITPETEMFNRCIRFGLMGISGEAAREFGYRKTDLSRLFVPAINLEFGCLILSRSVGKNRRQEIADFLRHQFIHSEDLVLAAVDKISNELEEKTYLSLFDWP